MTLIIILFLVAIGTTGFIVLRKRYTTSVLNLNFTNEYRNSYVELVNHFYKTYDRFERRGDVASEKYIWLTKNANKMQEMLGLNGVIHYVAPFQKYSVPNYQVLINTLPKFRENFLHDSEVNMVDDALLRHYGILEERVQIYQKQLRNPFLWFKQGFKELFSLPIYIINWFGIIPDRLVGKIISNAIFNVLTGIGGLVAFISGLVTIIQGKEQTVKFIKDLFHK